MLPSAGFKRSEENIWTFRKKQAEYWIIGSFVVGTFVQILLERGTAVAQWLRYCATNQKVAGSIPDGVMEFFLDTDPSDRTMALGSTQPLTEMSTRSISWR
jgi:hypothetical protein